MLLPHFGACEGQWLVWHVAEQYRILLHFAHLKFPGLLLQYSQARDLVVTTVGPAPEAGLNRSMVLVPGAVRVNISGFLLFPPVRSSDPAAVPGFGDDDLRRRGRHRNSGRHSLDWPRCWHNRHYFSHCLCRHPRRRPDNL